MRAALMLGLGIAALAVSASPALADRGRSHGWHGGWHGPSQYHVHHHFHHRGHPRHGWHPGRGHRGPPVVVVQPPPRVIYAPPPVIYAPPPAVVYGYPVYRPPYGELSIGLNIPLGR